jgi:hypothetical protein
MQGAILGTVLQPPVPLRCRFSSLISCELMLKRKCRSLKSLLRNSEVKQLGPWSYLQDEVLKKSPLKRHLF